MVKCTLYFGSPAYLSTRMEQLIIDSPGSENLHKSIPIEDIGVLMLDNNQITITQPLLNKLLEHNVAVITCDATHHPVGMFYVLESNTLQSQKFKHQLEVSQPLKKQLWQQVIKAKIHNQAKVLDSQKAHAKYLYQLIPKVKSGDTGNCEAKAAQYYWDHVFPDFLQFKRFREGTPPNNLLNYRYSLISAITARSIVASGLMPTLGIFHRNQYNAFCLADDMLEPYRPYVDAIVCHIVSLNGIYLQMTPDMKKQLLSIPSLDVNIGGQSSPLMVAIQRTIHSLVKCFEGQSKLLVLPQM
jgi:CRISPR-associated protein Cas1